MRIAAQPRVDPTAVRRQLERIIASEGFAKSERLGRLLRYTVEAVLDGKADSLKEYTLGVEVFEKGGDYDVRIDPIVRVTAARLRTKLQDFYAGEGADDPIVISMPKGAYVPAIASGRRKRVGWRRWTIAAASAIALAAVLLGWRSWQPRITSLAVLPFANLTGDSGQEYFADGLTEELINALAAVPNLRVAARTTVLEYKAKTSDVRDIGRRLGVTAVIEGSLRRNGEKLAVSAQLIDARTGFRRWSATYAGDGRGLLTLQSEVSRGIAMVVEGTLRRPVDPSPAREQAHALYLQGRYAERFERSHEARAFYLRAIDQDPTYALPHAALSIAYAYDQLTGRTPYAESISEVRRQATKALELDANLPEAHVAMARLSVVEWDWSKALGYCRRAVELRPGDMPARLELATILGRLERYPEAIAAMQKAGDLDPVSIVPAYNLAVLLFRARRIEQAMAQLNHVLELNPRHLYAHRMLAQCYVILHDPVRALAAIERARAKNWQDDPLWQGFHGDMLAVAGRRDDALRVLAGLAERYPTNPTALALVTLGLGDLSKTLDYLEEALQKHDPRLPDTLTLPQADPLRAEPRYVALRKAVGLP